VKELLKYVSVDIETTGLDERDCDIIEIGAVYDDLGDPKLVSQLERFHCYVLPPNGRTYTGEPYALSMHAEIFRRIALLEPGYSYATPEQAVEAFARWLLTLPERARLKNKVAIAGKNYGIFDNAFLKLLPEWRERVGKLYHHNVIDPGSMYLRIDDGKPPNTATCLERAGVSTVVPHTAVEDAENVVRLIRRHFGCSV